MVSELENLITEVNRVSDKKLSEQARGFVSSLRAYFAEIDSFLKLMVQIEKVKKNAP